MKSWLKGGLIGAGIVVFILIGLAIWILLGAFIAQFFCLDCKPVPLNKSWTLPLKVFKEIIIPRSYTPSTWETIIFGFIIGSLIVLFYKWIKNVQGTSFTKGWKRGMFVGLFFSSLVVLWFLFFAIFYFDFLSMLNLDILGSIIFCAISGTIIGGIIGFIIGKIKSKKQTNETAKTKNRL